MDRKEPGEDRTEQKANRSTWREDDSFFKQEEAKKRRPSYRKIVRSKYPKSAVPLACRVISLKSDGIQFLS